MNKPDIDDILLKPAGWQYDDYQKAKQALYDRLAAEAVDLSELGDDGVYHKIGKFIPIDKLKAIMEIKES